MKEDLIYLIRRIVKYSSHIALYVYLYYEEPNCIIACQGSGLFLHTFVFDPPTPNRVEVTPNRVEASKNA